MSTTAITVKNITNSRQSFDDKTLDPWKTLVVTKYTDDLLSAWMQQRVSLDPLPNSQELAIRKFSINPCQLPLPVRLHGGFQGLFTPGSISDGLSANVSDTPVMLLGPDNARVNFRYRNVGPNPVVLGGAEVAFSTGVIILQPGEMHSETFAPNVPWYAIAQTGLPSTLVGMAVKT